MTSGEGIVGYFMSKLIPVLSGIFGGLTLSTFWTPKQIRKRGRVFAIMMVILTSGSMSFAFGPIIINYLGLNTEDLNNVVALSYVIGAMSLALANWVGNFFIRNEEKDIGEVIQIVKDVRKGNSDSGSERQSVEAIKIKQKNSDENKGKAGVKNKTKERPDSEEQDPFDSPPAGWKSHTDD